MEYIYQKFVTWSEFYKCKPVNIALFQRPTDVQDKIFGTLLTYIWANKKQISSRGIKDKM